MHLPLGVSIPLLLRKFFHLYHTPESSSDRWDTLRLGHFTEDFYQDAKRLEDKLSTPSGVEWPVVGSSGELAALMNMVSNQSVRETECQKG